MPLCRFDSWHAVFDHEGGPGGDWGARAGHVGNDAAIRPPAVRRDGTTYISPLLVVEFEVCVGIDDAQAPFGGVGAVASRAERRERGDPF